MRYDYLQGITRTRVDEVTVGDERTVALYPDAAGAQPLAIDLNGAPNLAQDMFRIGQSAEAGSPVDPITTVIVLGKQYKSVAWVDIFFPPTFPLMSAANGMAVHTKFLYPMWGTSHLGNFDTLLPEGAPYSFSGLDVAWVPGKIQTHGWASYVSMEEAARAQSSLSWVARKSALPMFIVNRGMQFRAAARLLDTTVDQTYALGHVLNKGPGTEWDQPGVDMRDDINLGLNTILGKVTTERQAVSLVLSNSSYDAALSNEGFRAWHNGIILTDASSKTVNERRLAQYLGVREVLIINPTGELGAPLFGDVAWLLVRDDAAEGFEDDYGSDRFGARFAVNDGVALESWQERMIRVSLYPALKEYALEVVNPAAIFLITNTQGDQP